MNLSVALWLAPVHSLFFLATLHDWTRLKGMQYGGNAGQTWLLTGGSDEECLCNRTAGPAPNGSSLHSGCQHAHDPTPRHILSVDSKSRTSTHLHSNQTCWARFRQSQIWGRKHSNHIKSHWNSVKLCHRYQKQAISPPTHLLECSVQCPPFQRIEVNGLFKCTDES